MTTNITVKARSERGRWRAGHHFTRAGVTLDTSELTGDQLAAIKADPELFLQQAPVNLDGDALKREKAATKSKTGKAAWEAAEAKARTASELDEAAWTALPAADRVGRIEAQLGAGT